MNSLRLDQARSIFGTIKHLQGNVLADSLRHRSGEVRDLTMAQMTTLIAVRDAGEVTIKDLALATKVSSPSASTMIDRLVDIGVVRREAGKSDRREVRIGLTPLGEEMVSAMELEVLGSLSRLLEKLGPELAQQWCELNGRIQVVLDADGKSKEMNESKQLEGIA